MDTEATERDAKRYQALKNWLISIGNFVELSRADSEPFIKGELFFGPTFDEAVDSLVASNTCKPAENKSKQ